MSKKGFTLVELLAVIIILSLLILLVFPNITNAVRNHSRKTDEVVLTMIEKAASLYISDNSNDFPKKSENSYCITINELIENDYLKDYIEYNGNDITNTKSMQVTYNGEFNYELVNNDSCIDYKEICVPVTEETKTTGNVPVGEYNLGDEYTCEVKPGTSYTFFVISEEENKVNLIMDQNINSDGTLAGTTALNNSTRDEKYNLVDWYEEGSSTYGPLTAMNFLYNATKTWTNIPPLSYRYNDKEIQNTEYGYTLFNSVEGILTMISRDGSTINTMGSETLPLRARMPMYSTDLTKTEIVSKADAPYLYNNLIKNNENSIYAYWTISTSSSGSYVVYSVDYSGIVLEINPLLSNTFENMFYNNGCGVRPVISIPKKYIKVIE